MARAWPAPCPSKVADVVPKMQAYLDVMREEVSPDAGPPVAAEAEIDDEQEEVEMKTGEEVGSEQQPGAELPPQHTSGVPSAADIVRAKRRSDTLMSGGVAEAFQRHRLKAQKAEAPRGEKREAGDAERESTGSGEFTPESKKSRTISSLEVCEEFKVADFGDILKMEAEHGIAELNAAERGGCELRGLQELHRQEFQRSGVTA